MNWNEKIDSLLRQLRRLSDSFLDHLEGCTDEDVAKLERKFGHRLPAAFVALLKRSGRSWGKLMQGEDFRFPEMLEYRAIAESLLSDMENLQLDARDFVFFMHQGYQFLFFRAEGSDNPAVYHYNADDPGFNKVYNTFTEWLDVCIQEEIDLRAGLTP